MAIASPDRVGIADPLRPCGNILHATSARVAPMVADNFHSIAWNDVHVDTIAATRSNSLAGAALGARTVAAGKLKWCFSAAVDVHVVLRSTALADAALGLCLGSDARGVTSRVVEVVRLQLYTILIVLAGVDGIPVAGIEWNRDVREEASAADVTVVHGLDRVCGCIHSHRCKDRQQR